MNVLAKMQKKYHLRIPSHTDNLSIIRELVAKVCKGLTSDDISKIVPAVDVCANVIKNAYGNNSNQLIDVLIKIDSKKLTVTVADKDNDLTFVVTKVL